MARLFTSAQSEYLLYNGAIPGTYPFAVCAWAKCTDTTNNQVVFSLGDTDGLDYLLIAMGGAVGGDPVIVVAADEGVQNTAVTSTGYTSGTWHHICGIFVGEYERRVFVDGGSLGTNYDGAIISGIDNALIAAVYVNSTVSTYLNGSVCEVALWNLADWAGSTAADKADTFVNIALPILAKKYSSQFFRLGLIAYWPLGGVWGKNENNDANGDRSLIGSYHMSPYNTPSVDDHLPIIYQSRLHSQFRIYQKEISSSVSSTSSINHAINRDIGVFSTIVGLSIISFNIGAVFSLDSQIISSSNLISPLSTIKTINSELLSTSSVDQLLSRIIIGDCNISSASSLSSEVLKFVGVSLVVSDESLLGVSFNNILSLYSNVESLSTIDYILNYTADFPCIINSASSIEQGIAIISEVGEIAIVGGSTINDILLESFRFAILTLNIIGESSISSNVNLISDIYCNINGVSTISESLSNTIQLANLVNSTSTIITTVGKYVGIESVIVASISTVNDILLESDRFIALACDVLSGTTINSDVILTISLNHIISSTTTIISDIKVEEDISNYITLYIQGRYESVSDFIPLYLEQSTGSAYASIPLLITGDGITDGAIPFADSITLYIGRNDYVLDVIPLFVHGGADINSNIPLYTSGGISVDGDIPLVIPNVYDTTEQSLKLYTHGY